VPFGLEHRVGLAGIAYKALIITMAASVVVGTVLAWDIPWL
jgi:hypothetical protein